MVILQILSRMQVHQFWKLVCFLPPSLPYRPEFGLDMDTLAVFGLKVSVNYVFVSQTHTNTLTVSVFLSLWNLPLIIVNAAK